MSAEGLVVLVVALLAFGGSAIALLATPAESGAVGPWALDYAEADDPERSALVLDCRLHVSTLSEGFWSWPGYSPGTRLISSVASRIV